MTVKPDTAKIANNLEWRNLRKAVKRAGLEGEWQRLRFALKGRSIPDPDIQVQMRNWLYENMTALQIKLYANAPPEMELPPVEAGSTTMPAQAYVGLIEDAAAEAAAGKTATKAKARTGTQDKFAGFPLEHLYWCLSHVADQKVDTNAERLDAPSPAAYTMLVVMRSDPAMLREVAKRCMQESYVRRDDAGSDEEWLRITGIDDRISEAIAASMEAVKKDGNVAQFVKRAEGLSEQLALEASAGGAAAPSGAGPPGDPAGVQSGPAVLHQQLPVDGQCDRLAAVQPGNHVAGPGEPGQDSAPQCPDGPRPEELSPTV